jgi:hypothetical protein
MTTGTWLLVWWLQDLGVFFHFLGDKCCTYTWNTLFADKLSWEKASSGLTVQKTPLSLPWNTNHSFPNWGSYLSCFQHFLLPHYFPFTIHSASLNLCVIQTWFPTLWFTVASKCSFLHLMLTSNTGLIHSFIQLYTWHRSRNLQRWTRKTRFLVLFYWRMMELN